MKIKSFLFFLLGIAIILVPYELLRQNETGLYTDDFIGATFDNSLVIITSAGQSTDTYIVQNSANKIHLNHLFMPDANVEDLTDASTLVIVIGYSTLGLQLSEKDFDAEYKRVESLLAQDIPIVAIYLGGDKRDSKNNRSLMALVSKKADLLMTISEKDNSYIEALSASNSLPVLYFDELKDLSKPLASIFR